jgi:sortase A
MRNLLIGIIGVTVFSYGAYIPVKAEVAQYLIHNAWNTTVSTGTTIKPWLWADMQTVMRLSSKKHDQSLIVLSGDTGNVLAFGPGHNSGSYLLDDGGTIMISAHRDTHFEFLQDVALNDQFELAGLNGRKGAYKVTDIAVIDSDKQEIIIDDRQSELKLVTCYPFNTLVTGGPLRYVVTASLINDQEYL